MNESDLLSDFVVSSMLIVGGPAVSKLEIVQQLLQRLAEGGQIATSDLPELCDAVMRREALGTTGIGDGVAIPHGRSAALHRTMVILGVCRSPIDFESLDGRPTDIIALCIGPSEPMRRESQRRAEIFTRRLLNADLRDRLWKVTSAREVRDQFIAFEQIW